MRNVLLGREEYCVFKSRVKVAKLIKGYTADLGEN